MTTIYWVGDSTVKQNTIRTWPLTGIGQEFERFVKACEVRVENHAQDGRSTKSFLAEGRLEPIRARIQAGDFLFIQFGHNDENAENPECYADPEVAFPANLEIFVHAAREKGATPVIITPVTRFDRHHPMPEAPFIHDLWAESARRTGERLGVDVIDLTRLSEKLVDRVGEAAGTRYYMNIPAGVYPCYPEGRKDNTHLQVAGAVAFGELIARELYRMGGKYAELLCERFDQYVQENERLQCSER